MIKGHSTEAGSAWRGMHCVCRRTAGRLLAVFLAVLVAGSLGLASSPVSAQDGRPIVRPGDTTGSGFHPLTPLFRLFGVENRRQRVRMKERNPRERIQQPREPARPVIVEVPKEADARVVLVVGDSLAGELAEGLEATYSEVASVRVDSLVLDDVGLAGGGTGDLGDRIRGIVQGRKVAVVVALIGSHDVSDIETATGTAGFRSEEWNAAYDRRVGALIAAARAQRTPMVWVGLPPPKGQARRADFSHINTVAKQRVDASNAIYVDVWDVFLDENGGYTSYGPDVEGTRRRLRSGDGIGFTWPGRRKIAFFAERSIARILGSSGAFAFEGVEDDPNFIVLTGRQGAPETVLAGGEDARNEPVADTPQYRLIVQGAPLAPANGRVDDFRQVE
ncbi:GDSL-type esterase/lipase family protein [Stappia sp. MMSF_3263]|uniref:SGNH/GDSL hydrolase family protein n=1 Tax=Stappia sp. MMSF_3263 TaxID=3046693 RepID=UPI00273F7C2E|nr:GDSL-type esterase/lipase family protein [Stappia sp. MMSF_3263]